MPSAPNPPVALDGAMISTYVENLVVPMSGMIYEMRGCAELTATEARAHAQATRICKELFIS